MKKDFAPAALDVRAFARAGAQLDDAVPLAALGRLAADLPEAAVAAAQPIEWHAAGETRLVQGAAEQVWLSLRASGLLPMVCQRCLQPMDVRVDVDRAFRFVPDERIAAEEDDESDEDLLVISRSFDLVELLEDEFLMALPLVPSHDVCPPGGVPSVDEAEDPVFEEKPNPFAVLQGLRRGKSK